jgi:CDP-glucose 4,6-dehydratase
MVAEVSSFGGFYAAKRVLVTGHTGFKGTWLSLWLSELGAEVHGISLPPPTRPSLFDESRVTRRLAGHVTADVRDPDVLTDALAAARPEVVFHLAAQPLVGQSLVDPRGTFETNVMGTVNLLEAVRRTAVVRVCLVVTSDKCYRNHGRPSAYRETDALGGEDPYSASKACAELVAASYRGSYFGAGREVSLATARAGNVIGGGDWAADRLLPDCVRALEAGTPVVLRRPTAVRPWQHVLDALAGYLTLARAQWDCRADFADAFNFGPAPSGARTVAEVARHAADLWGGGQVEVGRVVGDGAGHEASLLRLDPSKAGRMLDFHPAYDLDAALALTIGWYRRRFDEKERFDAGRTCIEQIWAYRTG